MPTDTDAFVIYHNPRCSKSRAALALLREHGIEPEIVEYLRTPLDRATLKDLLRRLDLPAAAIVRRGEALFRDRYAEHEPGSDAGWLDVLVEHPELLERPIITRGRRAVLGRPPERVLDLL